MSEQKLREALERLTRETDNPVSREIGKAALAEPKPEQTSGVPDCGITGCLLPQGHDGEHLDPPCFATDLDALCKCGKPKREHIGKPLGMDGHWFEAALAKPRQAEEFGRTVYEQLFHEAVNFIRQRYQDWEGTADGQQTTLTGAANLIAAFVYDREGRAALRAEK